MGLFKKTDAKNQEGFLNLEIKPLVDWNEPNGEGAIISDRITKDGWKVGHMVREEPLPNHPDSGWLFFSGEEDEEYATDPNHFHVFAINTIANYDPDIIQYLHSPVGTRLIRTPDGRFIEDDEIMPIHTEKQDRQHDAS